MAVTSYVSMDGMLIGEITGGVMRNYGTDALGSVVDTASNGVVENTYRYKPYGGTLAKTGTAADPSFLWNGGSGYRATTLSNSGFYVRRRHFSDGTGQWTTVDPLWPFQPPFGYVGSNPLSRIDRSGQWPSNCCGLKRTLSQNFANYSLIGKGMTIIYSTLYWQVQRASAGQSFGPVSIKWEEKMNSLPSFYPRGMENQWIDATNIGQPSFPSLAKDQATCFSPTCPATPCDGNSSDRDVPEYDYVPTLPIVRCLCFRLTVFSQCNPSATVYQWSQTVSYQFTSQSIFAPLVHAPSDPITDWYCMQPNGVDCPQNPR